MRECYEAELQLVFLSLAKRVWEMELWHEDGIYGIIHMAAPMQPWILISALCEREKYFLEIDCPSAHHEIFHLFSSLKHFSLIRLRVSCNATFISLAKKRATCFGTSGKSRKLYGLVKKWVHLRWKFKVMHFWCSHIINKGLGFRSMETVFVCWKFHAIIFIHHKLKSHEKFTRTLSDKSFFETCFWLRNHKKN